ncbi:hydrophobic surface binding protein [Collybia nuda]|uniref:Hydrophobic surface binding protein n=1 Tax=Collybia nuda TaxID=64659 RepID=A0A9P5XZZ8_9AGAR|nr:hydrophobic surface binding protein [Collybia nuda]
MRVSSTLIFLVSLAVSGLATVDQVKTDITTISSQLQKLDASISAFPNTGGTLSQALVIHSNAVNLKSSIDQGTTDVKATPPPLSEDDAKSILASFETMAETVNDTLAGIMSKKAAIQALPFGGAISLVKQDLDNLNTSTSAFEGALIAQAPSDLQDEAATLKGRIDDAFSTAIAAFS